MTKYSHSSKELYQTCPYKWHLHYQKKYRSVRVGSALAFGNSFDLALNELLLTRDILKASDVFWNSWNEWKYKPLIDFYKSDYVEAYTLIPECQEELSKTEDPVMLGHLQNWYSMRQKGMQMLAAYDAEVLPEIKNVLSVQSEFEIAIPGTEDTVGGKLDLIAELGDGKTYILDNKTTSKPYPKNSCQTKPQTALYALGLPEYENRVGFLTVDKKTFKTQILTGVAPTELQETVMSDFKNLSESVGQNQFDRDKKGCMAFGQKCIYYSHCWGQGFSEDIYEEVKDVSE